jgi:phospholipase C
MKSNALRALALYWAFAAASGTLAACGVRAVPSPTVPGGAAASGAGPRSFLPGTMSQKISHVIVVVQENRSFDNLFMGFPGANTVSSGMNSKGQTIPLQPIGLEAPWGIDHRARTFFAACDGRPLGQNCRMDGFDKEIVYGSGPPRHLPYAYVPRTETKPYFDIAKQYVLGDNTFTSNIDESFASHQYFIAAQANQAVDEPNGSEGCGSPPSTVATLAQNRHDGPPESACFDSQTIGDELAAKSLPWRYYASGPNDLGYVWSAYQAISHIYNGPDWAKDIINPPSAFLKQVTKGQLAAVTWITPTCLTSDHASCLGNQGPDWVASVVNAVGESQFWDSTAIFVMWDEWGGWYDHVPPPYEDYDGLGIRVPLLVVSAYAKKGYVSHVQYEHGSILKFIEDTFGLARLAASDARANSPASDCFDFTKAPRPFKPIKTTLKAQDFIDAPPDTRPPDDD